MESIDNHSMKNKLILYLSCILVLTIGIGSAFVYYGRSATKNGMLNVNGTNITSINVTIRREKFSNPVLPFPNSFIVKISDFFSKGYYYHADLPLTEVLKSLGMNVEWVDDNTANVTFEDKKYVLDLAKVSIVEARTTYNLIYPVPGGRRVHTVLDRELILDGNTIKNALYEMGEKINIDIDYDKSIINITKRED